MVILVQLAYFHFVYNSLRKEGLALHMSFKYGAYLNSFQLNIRVEIFNIRKVIKHINGRKGTQMWPQWKVQCRKCSECAMTILT